MTCTRPGSTTGTLVGAAVCAPPTAPSTTTAPPWWGTRCSTTGGPHSTLSTSQLSLSSQQGGFSEYFHDRKPSRKPGRRPERRPGNRDRYRDRYTEYVPCTATALRIPDTMTGTAGTGMSTRHTASGGGSSSGSRPSPPGRTAQPCSSRSGSRLSPTPRPHTSATANRMLGSTVLCSCNKTDIRPRLAVGRCQCQCCLQVQGRQLAAARESSRWSCGGAVVY